MSEQKYIVWYHYKCSKRWKQKGIEISERKKSITILSTMPIAEAWRILLYWSHLFQRLKGADMAQAETTIEVPVLNQCKVCCSGSCSPQIPRVASGKWENSPDNEGCVWVTSQCCSVWTCTSTNWRRKKTHLEALQIIQTAPLALVLTFSGNRLCNFFIQSFFSFDHQGKKFWRPTYKEGVYFRVMASRTSMDISG